MDGYRDNFVDRPPPVFSAIDYEDDEVAPEFPVIVAQGERRLQVHAYCHWTNLLGARNLPLIADLRLDQLTDFAPHAVLLDFTHSEDDPRITYVGEALARECDIPRNISHLDQVPDSTLLARISEQFPQLIANQAPLGFEEEFVNQRHATILYRGMLLPFAEQVGGPTRYVLGVLNWKEQADEALIADLNRQIGPAFAETAPAAPWSEWIDAPPTARKAVISTLGTLGLAEVPGDIAPHLTLADWLASARELAQSACLSGERSRLALYAALSRTHDFALAAAGNPHALATLIADAGVTAQPRAPLLPLVKLVFGAHYDKTRLTEYATVLVHARRLGLGRGELTAHLARTAGGLKGILTEERRLRQIERRARTQERSLAARLADLPPQRITNLSPRGEEYTLLVARRMADGSIAVLGEVDRDPTLLAAAARWLVE
jgi:hypothetical protein